MLWPIRFIIGLVIFVLLVIAAVRVYHAYEHDYGPVHLPTPVVRFQK